MEKQIYFWSEPVQVGDAMYSLTVATSWEGLCWCSLGSAEEEEAALAKWIKLYFPTVRVVQSRENNLEALNQITEYLQRKRKKFTIPIHQAGTPFQKRVWLELTRIPYGTTATYQDIAQRVGCPRGARAVGLANSKNPIAVVVPCHRVIGKDGSLTGYAGGLSLKQKLLEVEGL